MRSLTPPLVSRRPPGERSVRAAVTGSTILVLAGSAAQLVDYAFFHLRIGVLDSSEDGGAFGVLGNLAAAGAAASAWWALLALRPRRGALVALAPLLTFLAADKVFRFHDHLPDYLAFYAPVLAGAFSCLVLVARRLPRPAGRLLLLGVALLAASFGLHLIGERILLGLGLAQTGWAVQVKAVLKHGCEVQGWFLVLIALAPGLRRLPVGPASPRSGPAWTT